MTSYGLGVSDWIWILSAIGFLAGVASFFVWWFSTRSGRIRRQQYKK